jgi:hypothetical protein
MPNRSSDRLSQKSYIIAKFGEESPLAEAREVVLNALILNPNMRAVELADSLTATLNSELSDRLAAVLIRELFARMIRAARRKQSAADRRQSLIPGFEHLPRIIPISEDGTSTELLAANTYDVREYLRILMQGHRARTDNDPRVKEARLLLDKMRKYSTRPGNKGITVRQVMLLEL